MELVTESHSFIQQPLSVCSWQLSGALIRSARASRSSPCSRPVCLADGRRKRSQRHSAIGSQRQKRREPQPPAATAARGMGGRGQGDKSGERNESAAAGGRRREWGGEERSIGRAEGRESRRSRPLPAALRTRDSTRASRSPGSRRCWQSLEQINQITCAVRPLHSLRSSPRRPLSTPPPPCRSERQTPSALLPTDPIAGLTKARQTD